MLPGILYRTPMVCYSLPFQVYGLTHGRLAYSNFAGDGEEHASFEMLRLPHGSASVPRGMGSASNIAGNRVPLARLGMEDNIPFAASSHPTTTVFISQEAVQYGLANVAYLTHMTCAEFEGTRHSSSVQTSSWSKKEIPQQSETLSSPQHLYPPFPSTSGTIQLQSMLPAGQEPSGGVVRNDNGCKNRRARTVDPVLRASRPPKPNSNQLILCELPKMGGAEDKRCGMVFANTKAMMIHISDMVCGHCIPNHKNDKTQRSGL
ncbi:hypothetical protein BDZ97DRAFT_1753663 [Flammula alnicola]|nr:hypothetical protein BDZ97DRAFT_1753663 [Flammula alnicola]